ncbi:MAG: pseudouridine synthase [Microthrixaceae bacterium]
MTPTERAPEPWVRFEDDHLLAVTKPAGVNTHRADAHAQDGMYEWVQRQRPHDALSILHRLDKGTSGLLLFGKTALANRSLSAQFERRAVHKEYELDVERDDARSQGMRCAEPIGRVVRGDTVDQPASTDFELRAAGVALARYRAVPHTGRTHQVRVHAAALGMPVLGDLEHGGASAPRLFLHAARLGIDHPTGGRVELTAHRPPTFGDVLELEMSATVAPALAATASLESRTALFDPSDPSSYLWIDRLHDGLPGARVERLGEVALVTSYADEVGAPWIDALRSVADLRAVYVQHRPRGGGDLPRCVSGDPHDRFEVTELGLRYLIDLTASTTSTGLFLDQRETRRRLCAADLTGRTVLNVFAHTGSLSVAAARAGAATTSLDLSKRYLEWAAENLRCNDLDPLEHDFIYGDALDWMSRLAKKGRRFDVVLLDPPSSSTARGRAGARWSAERDLASLVTQGTVLCAPGGALFVSTNLRRMTWARFLDHVGRGLAGAGRDGTIETQTVPLDHRSGPGDPPYLKAAWVTFDEAVSI